METKHTKEYAEKVALELWQGKNIGNTKHMRMIFVMGWMKSIEATNAKELLEALIELVEWEKYNYIEPELLKKINNAIKKAIT